MAAARQSKSTRSSTSYRSSVYPRESVFQDSTTDNKKPSCSSKAKEELQAEQKEAENNEEERLAEQEGSDVDKTCPLENHEMIRDNEVADEVWDELQQAIEWERLQMEELERLNLKLSLKNTAKRKMKRNGNLSLN